jgi:hypothetical protein
LIYTGSFQGVIILDKNPNNSALDGSTYNGNSFNQLTSAILSISATGKVKSIDGQNITIERDGKTITFNVGEKALIRSLKNTSTSNLNKNNPTATVVDKISDIKVGDNLNVNVKFLATGELEVISIMIIS